eukprot:TRINITY_DN2943_c1_g3_i4.p1 TRINITY_DN2943_c1_g3~~TRINITY_DN2943_c1_g3_i4.p1  ORF type:complete len:743 (+),score=240.76 TRINITY_DN2943_c1_g3_i4:160-2229(+)
MQHACAVAGVCLLLGVSARGDATSPWHDVRLTPEERAQQLAQSMAPDDIIKLLHGYSGDYVGNVAAQPAYGIPALTLNDGPQGFRDDARQGTTTAFASGLTVGASFDTNLALQWGAAMGAEFYQKGSNVQLGPGVCVARVPKNGRNFEYVSGEDPYLGYVLVQPIIEGIQKQGVIANVKHYVLNNQETKRTTINELVDERTRFEIYYPPFEGAIEADVGSLMCSYNKINGAWSCQNGDTLAGDLKRTLGFKGWVMSDWGATHNLSIDQGLDQEMPGGDYYSQVLTDAFNAGQVSLATLQDSAQRMLYPMFKLGIMDTPNPNSITNNVTSAAHNDLARRISENCTVLLENDGILPLNRTAWAGGAQRRIAVIGKNAANPIVHGGGSGQVIPYYVSDPLTAIRTYLEVDSSTGCSVKYNVCVDYDDGSNVASAVKLASGSDMVLVFAAADSGEGSDRQSLSLADKADALITALCAVSKPVVSAVAPGAILTPWRANVSALLIPFMPGQEYGNAVARIIFGEVSPSARLPLTFPNKENEVGFTPEEYPGVNGVAVYSEKLLVGYRWYTANDVSPAYPFGFGLGYTKFIYSGLSASGRAVTFELENAGGLEGTETPQMYVKFPAETDSPPLQLKGFRKVSLAAGEVAQVAFTLTDRDLSFYNVTSHAWQVVSSAQVFVGANVASLWLSANVHP